MSLIVCCMHHQLESRLFSDKYSVDPMPATEETTLSPVTPLP